MRALIGVGPAIALGSQKYSGPCADFAEAATMSSAASSAAPPMPAVQDGVCRVVRSPQPDGTTTAVRIRAASPTALAAMACRPALSVRGFSRQKLMRKKLVMQPPVQ